jgi:hypothetical protein
VFYYETDGQAQSYLTLGGSPMAGLHFEPEFWVEPLYLESETRVNRFRDPLCGQQTSLNTMWIRGDRCVVG